MSCVICNMSEAEHVNEDHPYTDPDTQAGLPRVKSEEWEEYNWVVQEDRGESKGDTMYYRIQLKKCGEEVEAVRLLVSAALDLSTARVLAYKVRDALNECSLRVEVVHRLEVKGGV